MDLSEGQRAAVLRASTAPLVVLTGGPGCGKTFATRAIVELWASQGKHIRLAAPTGGWGQSPCLELDFGSSCAACCLWQKQLPLRGWQRHAKCRSFCPCTRKQPLVDQGVPRGPAFGWIMWAGQRCGCRRRRTRAGVHAVCAVPTGGSMLRGGQRSGSAGGGWHAAWAGVHAVRAVWAESGLTRKTARWGEQQKNSVETARARVTFRF